MAILKSPVFATVIAYALTFATPAPAFSPLDSVRDTVKEIIDRAEQAGNVLLQELGRQMLAAIDAADASAQGLIASGLDAALVIEGEVFQDIEGTIARLEANADITLAELHELSASMTSAVARLPFVDATPELLSYRPRVIVPGGADEVAFTLVGPMLGDAVLSASIGEHDLQVSPATGNQAVVTVPREAFTFRDREATYETIRIEMDVTPPATWYDPWSWFAEEIVSREIRLLVLPNFVASYTIEPTQRFTRTETRTYRGVTHAVGKDSEVLRNVSVPPDLAAAGWRFDTNAIRGGDVRHQRLDDRGGSSCTGVQLDTLSESRVTLRHQIGHINGGVLGRDRDGWVNCALELPLRRSLSAERDLPPITGRVPFTSDVVEPLPAGTTSYRIEVRLFDGRTYLVQPNRGVPFSPLAVEASQASIHFRPQPPRDF